MFILVECHQCIAGVDGCALGNRDGCNSSVCRSCDLVLHLHSFQDQDDLTSCYSRALCDLDVQNGSRHRCCQSAAASRSCLRSCCRCRCCCRSRSRRCCRCCCRCGCCRSCGYSAACIFYFNCICCSIHGDVIFFHFNHSFRFRRLYFRVPFQNRFFITSFLFPCGPDWLRSPKASCRRKVL